MSHRNSSRRRDSKSNTSGQRKRRRAVDDAVSAFLCEALEVRQLLTVGAYDVAVDGSSTLTSPTSSIFYGHTSGTLTVAISQVTSATDWADAAVQGLYGWADSGDGWSVHSQHAETTIDNDPDDENRWSGVHTGLAGSVYLSPGHSVADDASLDSDQKIVYFVDHTIDDGDLFVGYWKVKVTPPKVGAATAGGIQGAPPGSRTNTNITTTNPSKRIDTSTDPIYYGNGAISYSSTDLSSDGFDGLFSQTRSFTNTGLNFAPNIVGRGFEVTPLAYLTDLAGDASTVLVHEDANSVIAFDNSSGYVPRFYSKDALAKSETGASEVYTWTNTAGAQTVFYGFNSSININRRGKFISFTSPDGKTITTSYNSTTNQLDAVARTTGGGSTDVTEEFAYTYNTDGEDPNFGLTTNVTLKRKVGSGSYSTVRQVDYEYYDGTTDFGRAGDLERATIKDADNHVLNTRYYRYYKDVEESFGGTTHEGYVNGLMFVVEDNTYARLAAAVSDVDTASDATIAQYANLFFEYDPRTDRVTKQVIGGMGDSESGGGLSPHSFSYEASNASPGENTWDTETTETLPDGSSNIVFTNAYGQVMLKAFEDAAGNKSIDYYSYDDDGRVILHAHPSAAPSYNVAEPDLMDSLEGGNYLYLNDTNGLIETWTYGESTTASTSKVGDVDGYLKSYSIQNGDTGTAIKQEDLDYKEYGSVFLLNSDTKYSDTGGSDALIASYAYTLYSGTSQVETKTTTLPTVTTGQNGPGSAKTTEEVYDPYGRVIWSMDEDGYITYRGYDQDTGALTMLIVDVDTSLTSDEPSGWTTPSGGGKHLVTEMAVDDKGRTTKLTDPNGNVTYTHYDDINHEVRVYPGWHDAGSGVYTTTGPIRISRTYQPPDGAATGKKTQFRESLTSSAAPAYAYDGTNYVPTGQEVITAPSIISLSRAIMNDAGQVTSTRRYFSMAGVDYDSSTGSRDKVDLGGSASNDSSTGNYHETLMSYGVSGDLVRSESASGTITRMVYDGRGEFLSTWIGTDDTDATETDPDGPGGNSNNMVEVSENEYDFGGAGDGNLTMSTQKPGTGYDRITDYFYDWRDRLVATKSGAQTAQIVTFTPDGTIETKDAFVISIIGFPDIVVAATGGSPTATTVVSDIMSKISDLSSKAPYEGLLDGLTVTSHTTYVEFDTNDVGRTLQYSVRTIDGGTKDTQTFALAATAPTEEDDGVHRPVTYQAYDNLGEVTSTQQFDGDQLIIQDVGGDGVPDMPGSQLLSRTLTDYDNLGRGYRTRVVSVDPGNGSYSDSVSLSTKYWYDGRGNVIKESDPGGLVTKTVYDGVGRVTAVYQTDGYGDVDSVYGNASDFSENHVISQTEYQYDGNGNVIFTTQRDRFHDAADSLVGSLGDPSSTSPTAKARVSLQAAYYDAVDRLTDSVNFGTNHGALHGGSATTDLDPGNDGTPDRPTSPTAGSDYVLRTTNTYWVNEVQNLQITGTPSSGSFSLEFNGQTATGIAHDADAAAIQSALIGLSNIGPDDVTVASPSAGLFVVTFGGALAQQNLPLMSVSSITFNSGSIAPHNMIDGSPASTADPKGIVALTRYDLLGRTTRTIADYVDGSPSAADDQTTDYTYNGNGDILTMTARLPSSAIQETKYIYAASQDNGSDIDSNDILTAVDYPDKSTGAASSSSGYEEVYTVNALGERMTYTDRNETTHTYTYDILGRLTVDDVQGNIGSGVDTWINKLTYAYNTQGLPSLFTSYGGGGGNDLVNQVEYVYNGLGQLTLDYQEHVGAVNGSTPVVQYVYSEMGGGANHSRLTEMIYPDGRILHYGYATGIDDSISRLSFMADDDGDDGPLSTHIVDFSYLGLSTVVKEAHPEVTDGFDLSYIKDGGDTVVGDAGDQYKGLDRFGRILDQRWTNDDQNTDLDRFTYTYDANSNVMTKDNLLHSANDESYTYDDLNRLVSFDNGDEKDWTLDALGNWVSVSGEDGDRETNAQNQDTVVGGNSLEYDNNGNLTTNTDGNFLHFDAWNREVLAYTGETLIRIHNYDALGRQLDAFDGSVWNVHYVDQNRQVIQDSVNYSYAVSAQYVWNPMQRNVMILRDQDTDADYSVLDGGGSQRLYVMHDANNNVTGLVNTAGTAQEHYSYDPYGEPIIWDGSYSSTAGSSSLDWDYLFQGMQYDATLHQYTADHRIYDSVLGKWIQQDPAGYVDGPNTYQFVKSNPVVLQDPQGLRAFEMNRNIGATMYEPWSPKPQSEVFTHSFVFTARLNYWGNYILEHTYSWGNTGFGNCWAPMDRNEDVHAALQLINSGRMITGRYMDVQPWGPETDEFDSFVTDAYKMLCVMPSSTHKNGAGIWNGSCKDEAAKLMRLAESLWDQYCGN